MRNLNRTRCPPLSIPIASVTSPLHCQSGGVGGREVDGAGVGVSVSMARRSLTRLPGPHVRQEAVAFRTAWRGRSLVFASAGARFFMALPTGSRRYEAEPARSIGRSMALGNRCWKSKMATHSGVMKTRAIWGQIGRRFSSQVRPISFPRDRMVMASYSGAMPSTTSVRAVPRIWSTLKGIVSVSIDTATFIPSLSTFILGLSGGVPSTISVPFQ